MADLFCESTLNETAFDEFRDLRPTLAARPCFFRRGELMILSVPSNRQSIPLDLST